MRVRIEGVWYFIEVVNGKVLLDGVIVKDGSMYADGKWEHLEGQ